MDMVENSMYWGGGYKCSNKYMIFYQVMVWQRIVANVTDMSISTVILAEEMRE